MVEQHAYMPVHLHEVTQYTDWLANLQVIGEGEVVDGGQGQGKDEDIQRLAVCVQRLCIADQLCQNGVHPVPLLRCRQPLQAAPHQLMPLRARPQLHGTSL